MTLLVAGLVAALVAVPVAAPGAPSPLSAAAAVAAGQDVQMTPSQLFELAGRLEAAGDTERAAEVYGALAGHPRQDWRSEARFRWAMMEVRLGQFAPAAARLREILAEEPGQARVRTELAAVLVLMGERGEARRELRAIRPEDLPEDVFAMIGRFERALKSARPYGVSFDLGLAADSNINRATRSDVLGTVIGDFTLDEDARETSGTGVRTGMAAFARLPIARDMRLLARVNGQGSFYDSAQFNDVAIGLAAGPEWAWQDARLQLSAAGGWRWFGGEPLSREWGADARLSTLAGPLGQVSLQPSWRRVDDRKSNLRDGDRYTLALALERPLTKTLAARLSLRGGRMDARSAAYSDTSVGLGLFASLDRDEATWLASFDVSGLQADDRVFLYPETRRDRTWRASLGAVIKPLEYAGFAPRVEVARTHADSSIEVYEYRRTTVEVSLQRVF